MGNLTRIKDEESLDDNSEKFHNGSCITDVESNRPV